MKGTTLRLARLRAGLRQQDIADALGCSRARVGQIEHLATVPADWVHRYGVALKDRASRRLTTKFEAATKAPEVAREGGDGTAQGAD